MNACMEKVSRQREVNNHLTVVHLGIGCHVIRKKWHNERVCEKEYFDSRLWYSLVTR